MLPIYSPTTGTRQTRPPATLQPLLSCGQISTLMGISESSFYRHVRPLLGRGCRVGASLRWPQSEVSGVIDAMSEVAK